MSTIAHQPSKNASQHKIYTAPLPTDRYTLLDRINTASSSEMFGTLHRALERSTNRALVIRVLNGLSEEVQTAMISCFTSMFAAPQQVSGCLSALQEVYVHKDTVWLLHPYNANGSVYDFMQTQKGKRIGHEETIRMLLRNVVHYIAQLHAHGFYHGHIKASNLLLHGGDDGIEIADYGLAQYQLKYGLPSDITSTYLHWAPPESCSGSISTTNDECRPENDDANRNQTRVAIRPAAWDIWTLGTLAFELSIGAPPYVQFAPRRAHALIRDHSPPILVGNFSPLLKAFVARCLTKDLEKRPTAAQLCEDAYLVGTTSGGAQTKKHYSNSMNAPAVLSNYVTPPRSNGNTRVLSGRTRSASRHFTSTTSGSATNSSELSYGSNAPWVHRVPCAPTYPDKGGHLSLHDALTRALENVHCYPPATQTTGNSKVGLNTNEDAHIEDTTLPVSTTTTVLRLLRVLEALESMPSIPGNDTKVSHISFSDVFRCRLQETLHDVGSSIAKASNESGELVTCCEGITPQRLYATLLRRWKEESKRVLEGNERQSD